MVDDNSSFHETPADIAAPYSESAEQAILATLLVSEELRSDIAARIKPQDFYLLQHKVIYEIFLELVDEGKKFDFVTLIDKLQARKSLDTVVSLNFLKSLTESSPTISNISDYIDIVIEKAAFRKLIHLSSELENSARDPGEKSAEDIIEDFSKYLLDVRNSQLNQGQLLPIAKVIDEIEASRDKPNTAARFLKTGYPRMDKLLKGLHKTDLIILAARPGMGKTTLAMNIVDNISQKHREAPIVVFSIEMSDIMIASRMIAANQGPPLSKLLELEQMKSKDWKSFSSSAKTLKDSSIFIDSSAQQSPLTIRSKLTQLQNQHRTKPALFVIDYLQLMQYEGRPGDSRNLEIASITRQLKSLAKEFDCPALVLSQLSRASKGDLKAPQLSDLRDSGAIEQDADVVLFLHRTKLQEQQRVALQTSQQAELPRISLIIGKHRNGPVGSCELQFDGEHTLFSEPDNYHSEADMEGNYAAYRETADYPNENNW